MTILWICGLPEEVRKVHPVTDVPSAAWSWVVGHLPPPKDVELHVLCPVFGMKDVETHFDHGGAHWHCFRLKRWEPLFLRLRFHWSIRAFVRNLKPDVVHGWGGESGCGLLATYCSPYAVVSVQGLLKMLCANAKRWHIQVPELGSVSAWFRRVLEGWTYRRAHRLLVESETAAESLRALYGLESEVILHPLRPEFVLTQRSVTAVQAGLATRASQAERMRVPREAETGVTNFLFVGQMTARKGVMDALMSFSGLDDKSARLVMVGSGDQDGEIDGFIARQGIGNRVRWIKSCSADELRLLMAGASAIVAPSYGDTGPTILKEALSQGLYPICYDNTGAAELVKRYGWGRLVPTGDIGALKAAMADVPEHKNMTIAEIVQKDLCREKAWEGLSNIYSDVMSPVDFVMQRGSSPAIRQRVTHLRRMCAGLRDNGRGKRVVVSCCTGIRQNLRTALGARFKRRKVIREINEWPLSVTWSESKIKQWFEVKVLPKLFDGFICISDALVEFCREHGRKGAKIVKIPMTVDVEAIDSVRRIVEPPNTQNTRKICYAGGMTEAKDGVGTLKQAWEIVKTQFSDIDLKLLHGVSHEEAIAEMKYADCLVLARPDSQQARAGFPTKLGEYLALGRPVVVTKVGEIPRFLEDGKTAYLVEPGSVGSLANKLQEVFADKERAEKIGLVGKEVAKTRFDWRNHEGTLCEWMRSFI